jgi:hypothetical protein
MKAPSEMPQIATRTVLQDLPLEQVLISQGKALINNFGACQEIQQSLLKLLKIFEKNVTETGKMKKYAPVVTLSLCTLSCELLRERFMGSDILRFAKEGRIPYLLCWATHPPVCNFDYWPHTLRSHQSNFLKQKQPN